METQNVGSIVEVGDMFLSYLWGMETWLTLCGMKEAYSSYPTYEEWKHPTFNKNKLTFPRSYPTYEEWKRIIR